jgi:hypothetical protein
MLIGKEMNSIECYILQQFGLIMYVRRKVPMSLVVDKTFESYPQAGNSRHCWIAPHNIGKGSNYNPKLLFVPMLEGSS